MQKDSRFLSSFGQFFRVESLSGLLLIFCSIIALVIANSSFSEAFERVLSLPFFLEAHHKVLTVRDWINEGLMAIFFLSVGLEIRKELEIGELSTRMKASLPIIAALGGMIVPAIIYLIFNNGVPTSKGWGIPVATDIAFSLGVITLLGNRVPAGLKIFVAALAIADDLGAILVIAFFYANDIDFSFLLLAIVAVFILISLSKIRTMPAVIFYLFGAALWYALLRSGIHPSISGAALAFLLPSYSASKNVMSRLGRVVAFIIMPVFALANAGLLIEFSQFTKLFSGTVSLGIIFGLLAGKTIGISSFSFFASKFGIAMLPKGVNWRHIFGASILCSIGFTMSLFITGLAFGLREAAYNEAKLSILVVSLIGGISGYCFLRFFGARSD